jgi:hypothetical protein
MIKKGNALLNESYRASFQKIKQLVYNDSNLIMYLEIAISIADKNIQVEGMYWNSSLLLKLFR